MAYPDVIANIASGTAEGLRAAATSLINTSISVVISLIGAVIIILIGWIIARVAKQIVIKVLQSAKVDQWTEEHKLEAAIGGKELSGLAGSLVKWYIIALFLAQAAEIIALQSLKQFLQALVNYIPSVIGAIVIFVGGLLLGRYVKNAVDATQHKLRKPAAMLVEVIVVLFAGIMALTLVIGEAKVQILVNLLNIFLTPFLVALAIVVGVVVGLSVGVAFKEDLRALTSDIKKSLK